MTGHNIQARKQEIGTEGEEQRDNKLKPGRCRRSGNGCTDGWKDISGGRCADNGPTCNFWEEENGRQGLANGDAAGKRAMSTDNGLHLMSGGRRDYRDKKRGMER